MILRIQKDKKTGSETLLQNPIVDGGLNGSATARASRRLREMPKQRSGFSGFKGQLLQVQIKQKKMGNFYIL